MRSELLSRDHDATMSRMERLLALRSMPGWATMSTEELAVLAAHTRERHMRAGEHVQRVGEHTRKIHFVLRGEVELRSGEHVLRTFRGKSVIGLPAFARLPSPYDAVLTKDSVLLEAQLDDVLEIYEDNFNILRNALRGLARATMQARRQLGSHAGFAGVIRDQPDHPGRPLDLVERMWALRSTLGFVQNRLDGIAELAKEATEIRVPAGTTLWNEGDLGNHFLVIIAGLVRCESETEGLGFRFGPGDGMGALDANSGEPRWFTAVVHRDLVALQIGAEQLVDVMEDYFEMALDTLEGFAGHLLELTMAIAEDPAAAAPAP